MMCPNCGHSMDMGKDKKPMNDEGNMLNSMVKNATANKLKSLRSARSRPDSMGGKGGITRGGRYSKN